MEEIRENRIKSSFENLNGSQDRPEVRGDLLILQLNNIAMFIRVDTKILVSTYSLYPTFFFVIPTEAEESQTFGITDGETF